ncbi:hypothetical protein GJR96_04050 [Haloferax sp. MBLA0076]|uniref:Uncharacterized protein n=1 Tax=Haloferax litoreum TaxID=2666140 RepID=A0A6A8GE17_9EURY|nr:MULTISPECIES: hypothetical protein [Haloferax]KAB1192653.1 hypothetical protein Hfx1148_04040 [Haloferax sp. CBA1148]MRX21129.1 hypothetical protein [Haloferax litoreum]
MSDRREDGTMTIFADLVFVVFGVVLFVFAEDMLFARRFGPITDGARSSETGGYAFRFLGVVFIAVGVAKLLGF